MGYVEEPPFSGEGLAILPFRPVDGVRYHEEMGVCEEVFFERMKGWEVVEPGVVRSLLKEKEIDEGDYPGIAESLGVRYLLFGEITQWQKYRHYPRSIFLSGYQSFTNVGIRIRILDTKEKKVLHEDFEEITLQGDYGKGHGFVCYREVVEMVAKELIKRLVR